jgi:hypothetical protein
LNESGDDSTQQLQDQYFDLEQQLLLKNDDSKESLVKSLELIAFPSSAHHSG